MKVIGLTGGIGSGKSVVSGFLAELGAVVIDADRVGHEALKPGTEVWCEVVAAFGREIVAPSGDIDREKLGRIVFSDPECLSRLNRIVHPRMYDMIVAEMEEYRKRGVEVVVLEAAILLEAGWISLVDKVWVTVAAQSAVLKRLEEKLRLSEEESLARIHCQLPSEERLKHADVIIDTDCGLGELKTKVGELWRGLHSRGV